MNLTEAFLLAMASWRLAAFLIDDDGPFHLMSRFRQLIGIEETDFGLNVPDWFPLNLFGCVSCMAFWTAILMWSVWYFQPIVVQILGIWGFASFIAWIVAYLGRRHGA